MSYQTLTLSTIVSEGLGPGDLPCGACRVGVVVIQGGEAVTTQLGRWSMSETRHPCSVSVPCPEHSTGGKQPWPDLHPIVDTGTQ
jgi:hypothetical protein